MAATCNLVLLLAAATLSGAEVVGEPSRKLRPVRGSAMPAPMLRGGGSLTAPQEVFVALEDEGAKRVLESPRKLLSKSIAAGICVGLGGILCAGVGGDIGEVPFWAKGQGLARFAFGAIGYPLSITLVTLTGSSAFTGNLPMVAAAIRAGKADLIGAAYLLGITYVGCFIGTVLMGALCAGAALPAAKPCIAISLHKLELTALQTLLRGVGGGLCISLAITMATFAIKHGGGVVSIFTGIWLPIMTYVTCDYEHCLANFVFFAAAQVTGSKLGLLPMLALTLTLTLKPQPNPHLPGRRRQAWLSPNAQEHLLLDLWQHPRRRSPWRLPSHVGQRPRGVAERNRATQGPGRRGSLALRLSWN